MQTWTTRFLFAALIGVAVPSAATADPIVVGVPPNAAGCIPFGCNDGIRYQQIYAAAAFPGLFAIAAIAFPHTLDPISNQIDPANYQIVLSTTPRQVGQLSADFNSNVGADAAVVFAGPLAGEVPRGSSLTFTLAVPFVFDPAAGNLLLDVLKQGGTFFGDDGVYLDYQTRMNGLSSSIQLQISSGVNADPTGGLVTVFTGEGADGPAPVPEPATLLLLGSGIAVGLLRRLRSDYRAGP